jgi:hypoxanthine phosphoribosyltransferase
MNRSLPPDADNLPGQAARIPLPYDYDRVESVVMGYVPLWRTGGFDGVVAIARGGLIPATIAATALDLPLFALTYARAGRRVAWFTAAQPAPASRLLLVEDIAGRGTTLVDCLAFLRSAGHDARTFTLAYDAQSRLRPDYSQEIPPGRAAWFPWERESITDAFAATDNQPGQPLHRYASWAIDLDGVLLPDLPATDYVRDLEDTLWRRDRLKPCAALPRLDLDLNRVAIITGRPEPDRARTRAWLDRHGFRGPLAMRDPGRHTAAQTPAHKAEAILAGRHTHFLESDAAQAIDIALRLKVARVYWWDGARAIAVAASASDPPA